MAKRPNKPVRSKAVTVRGRWKKVFLQSLAETGNVTVSATVANVERGTVYDHRKRDPLFEKAFNVALDKAADLIEHALRERAVNGVVKHVTHKGYLVTVPVDKDGKVVRDGDPAAVGFAPLVERQFDTTAAIFLLKGIRPEKYRDNHHHTHEPAGPRTLAEGETAAAALLADLRKRVSPNG